ncbi:hypothetical protein BDZ94DRAFT_747753 [Collybia nuda]|uniref:rRNA-processing protein n=1 Tax=Collybia nuda TaxID=64659 RepID=A0A9P5Y2B3_9AGAR|nr:hypothetical protein BDZ94DRAFT_747753 [Collybia nuda]
MDVASPIPLASSSNGRQSGKPWKAQKTATVRTHLQKGVKTKTWHDRVRKTQKALSIKKLETELKEEKQADFQRNYPGTEKTARLRRKAGRSKKIHG